MFSPKSSYYDPADPQLSLNFVSQFLIAPVKCQHDASETAKKVVILYKYK